jgi:hypothetical protein
MEALERVREHEDGCGGYGTVRGARGRLLQGEEEEERVNGPYLVLVIE